MGRARVAFVYPHSSMSVPPGDASDAIAIVTIELSRRLSSWHEVTIYPKRARGQAPRDRWESVAIRRLDVRPDLALGTLKRLDGILWRNPTKPFRTTRLYYPFYVRRLIAELRKNPADILHLHGIPGFVPVLRRHTAARVILHVHDHAVEDFDRETVAGRLDATDLILGCSRFIADRVARRFPEIATRCHALPNGVDLDRFRPASPDDRPSAARRRVLFVGRISPEKGVHVLLDAFRRVISGRDDVDLELVGPPDFAPWQHVDPLGRDPALRGLKRFYDSPPVYHRLLGELADREIGSRVILSGRVPTSRMPERYRRADLFIFPSIWPEPFGMPILEAMASGLPVIASRTGAHPETVENGRTGLLVPRDDPAALAAAIEDLLDHPERSRAMGEAGRRRAEERFSWDHVAEKLRDHYRNVLEAAGTSRRVGV